MGKRELVALLDLSSWCLVMVERLFLAVPRGCPWFVIVVFPGHTPSLFLAFDEQEEDQLNIYVSEYRILGDCLLISSLPGKALRSLVESRGLRSDSTCVLKAKPGKLDIKRSEPGILFISLPIVSVFKLAIL